MIKHLFVSTLLFAVLGAFSAFGVSFDLNLNIDVQLQKRFQRPDRNHPDYPAYLLISHLTSKTFQSPSERIAFFEQMLSDKQFKLLVEGKNDNQYEMKVGAQGSFSLWRDLLYLMLGRAYYEDQQMHPSIKYFNAIQSYSPFYPIAVLHSNYAHFYLNEFEQAMKKLQSLRDFNFKMPHLKDELALQEGFLLIRNEKYFDALKKVENLKFARDEVAAFRHKVYTEAYFQYYLQIYIKLSFEEKIEHLQKITKTVELIQPQHRDGNVAYLAAETYWHLAVAYRIQDPVKHEKFWKQQLHIADGWISPYVTKSIKEQKAYLSEEAFFFSISLLWERQAETEALDRLNALPEIYPQGIYREDAYQLLGDYYFERQKFKQATHYYRKLADIGVENKAAYGVYKAAWSFYNDKDKWKALRHFERLFEHYAKLPIEVRAEKSELAKESKQDLILVMSEILSADAALKELNIFPISETEKIDMSHDLGLSYQKIGTFENSMTVWRTLMNRHLGDDKALVWLGNLLKDYQSIGKRTEISTAMKEYYPKWKKLYQNPAREDELFDEWTKIILYLHKEAKKTDDARYWQAVDLAYDTYEEINPNGKNPDVWFYGAQKFEQKRNIWKAIEWYEKASLFKDFKQADDSALSVLTLVNSENDELSIMGNKEKQKEIYLKVVKHSKWFIDHAPSTLDKQKELARMIYVEANHFLALHEDNKKYFEELFANSKWDESFWTLYATENQRFYTEKKWMMAHELADFMWELRKPLSPEQKTILNNLRQETAFQVAYTEEQKKQDIDRALARKWYQEALTVKNADRFIRLKSWHNFLLTFKVEELALFEEELLNFKDEWKEIKSEDEKKLNYNIYTHAILNFEQAKHYYKKSLYLPIAADYTNDSALKENMNWDAFLLSANYHQWERFDELYSILKADNSPFLKEERNLLFITKMYLHRQKYEMAWEMIKEYFLKAPPTTLWPTFKDLITFADEDIKEQMYAYLKANEAELKSNELLKPVWSKVYQVDHFSKLEDILDSDFERQPAAIEENDADIVIELKKKLAVINNSINEMNDKKLKLKETIQAWLPQLSRETLCSYMPITQKTYDEIAELKADPIETPQWPEFVTRIDQTLGDIQKSLDQEKHDCQKLTKELVFFDSLKAEPNLFCADTDCLFDKGLSDSDIIGLEKEWFAQNKTDELEKFMFFLKAGAIVYAEYLAAFEKDKDKQIYMYGILRFAMSDNWNGVLVMKSLESSRPFMTLARNYQTDIVNLKQ
ncbi:MAG: hypothetical protein JNM93_00065 [Bacteriovoracaceae bacterium]|nr:hypothetical protein [Bacteriovoracaceae bacterium]